MGVIMLCVLFAACAKEAPPETTVSQLEMTELCDRTLRAGGPALLFEKPAGFDIPVLGNLFGTVRRIALAMGRDADAAPEPALRDIGRLLAVLREPEPPQGMRDALDKIGMLKIEELRREAEIALGADFDIRAFHDELLTVSSAPLGVMEAHMRAWIEAEKAAAE